MSKLNIKVTVLSLLVALVLVFSILMVVLQSKSNLEVAKEATSRLFLNISEQVRTEMQKYDAKSAQTIELLEVMGNQKALRLPQFHPLLLKSMTKNMEYNPFIYSFYIGHKTGEFYQIINLQVINNLNSKLDAPSNAIWNVVQVNSNGVKTEKFLDKELKLIQQRRSKTSYNPSVRPWYQDAHNQEGINKTKPYMFTSLQDMGITYSKRVGKGTVLGLDIAIQSLNTVLNKQKLVSESEVYIFREGGEIIAHRKVGFDINKKELNINDFYTNFTYEQFTRKPAIVTMMGKEYFKYYAPLFSQFQNQEFIVLFSPLENILAPYEQKQLEYLLLSVLIFFLVSIPFGIYLLNTIVKPIHALQEQNEKIKNQQFENVTKVPTFISELDSLSSSLFSLTCSINDYKCMQKELIKSYSEITNFFEFKKMKDDNNHEIILDGESQITDKHIDNIKKYINEHAIYAKDEDVTQWLKKGGFI